MAPRPDEPIDQFDGIPLTLRKAAKALVIFVNEHKHDADMMKEYKIVQKLEILLDLRVELEKFKVGMVKIMEKHSHMKYESGLDLVREDIAVYTGLLKEIKSGKQPVTEE